MKVKVIASNPDLTPGIEQDTISNLIGNVYDVIFLDKEDNSVNVYEPTFKGEITLNNGEYKVIN